MSVWPAWPAYIQVIEMDEEKDLSGAQEPEEKPKSKKRSPFRRILALALSLALVALAVLVFIYHDRLTDDGLRELFGRSAGPEQAGEAFAYEAGSDQDFALAGNGLAAASSSAVQLLDSSGKTVFKQVVSFGVPAVFACQDRALFCDIGGKQCINAGFDGSPTQLDFDGNIISADMNGSGWFTVISEEAGYKGLVQVYDPDCQLIYKWWSGTGYVLKAAVSPDNRLMAALCVDSDGGKIHIFSLSSENELACAEFDGDLLFDMYFMADGTICSIGEEMLYFIDTDAQLRGSYSLDGLYLNDYDFGSSAFAALYLSEYRTGAAGTVVTLDSRGEVLGHAEMDKDMISMSASGKQLLVMSAGGLSLYSQDMSLSDSLEKLMTARSALLRPNGDALLLSAYSAELYKF